jgi:hypothetical protein
MSTPIGGKARSRTGFKLKETISGFEPSELRKIASRLEKSQSGLDITGSPKEISKLIKEFLTDTHHKNEDSLHKKWIVKRKDLLDIVIVAGRKGSVENLDYSQISRILEKAFLIILSHKRIPGRYIEAMGYAALNNMGNQKLWRMLSIALENANLSLGRRAVIWKREMQAIKAPVEHVTRNLSSAAAFSRLQESIAVENTWFGSRIMREGLHQIASHKLDNKYRNLLIGDYSSASTEPDDYGILADLPVEELSSFINSYCANLRSIPSSDIYLDYFTSTRVMDVPSAGVKWNHPLIYESTRETVSRYLLGSDFRTAFDHILMHQERKQYWIKWLESGHIRRIRVFGNMSRIRKYKFNCPVAALEFPTLQMDLGSCYAYECGQKGSGALYVYPSQNGPMKWEEKIRTTRHYKRYILDGDRGIPERWFYVRHSTNWQRKVDFKLMKHYRLKR